MVMHTYWTCRNTMWLESKRFNCQTTLHCYVTIIIDNRKFPSSDIKARFTTLYWLQRSREKLAAWELAIPVVDSCFASLVVLFVVHTVPYARSGARQSVREPPTKLGIQDPPCLFPCRYKLSLCCSSPVVCTPVPVSSSASRMWGVVIS